MAVTTRLASCAALACLALPAAMFGDVLYTDTTFTTASYTPPAFTYIQNDSTAGQIGTVAVSSGPAQDAGGGFSGNALETAMTVTAAGDTSTVLELGVINAAFTYNPAGAQGALQFVSGSIESKETFSNVGYGTPSPEFEILIEQGGNYFIQNVSVPSGSSSSYVALSSTDLVAADFIQLNTSTGATVAGSHPNFSSGTMEFGLYMLGGSEFAPSNTETFYFSNLSLDLTPTPEPAGLLLVGTALGGLAMLRRRNTR